MQLPLNVSPVSASFFGIWRLGIHPVRSVACSSTVGGSLRYVCTCFSRAACDTRLAPLLSMAYSAKLKFYSTLRLSRYKEGLPQPLESGKQLAADTARTARTLVRRFLLDLEVAPFGPSLARSLARTPQGHAP